MPIPPDIQRFAFLKAVAHFEGAWENCACRKCRKRKKCTGGPRGSFTRNRIQVPGSAAGATGTGQEAGSAAGTTGTGQEAGSAAGATGTGQEPGSAAGTTGIWISVPICRADAPAEWWAGLRPALGKASPSS